MTSDIYFSQLYVIEETGKALLFILVLNEIRSQRGHFGNSLSVALSMSYASLLC